MPLSPLKKHLIVILSTACAYFLLFKANAWLFSSFELSSTVNWVFLPSGLRLLFVLLFLYDGAIGIALATAVLTYQGNSQSTWVYILVTSLISGFAPFIARLLALDWFKLDPELQNLHARTLFKLSVLFAITSALMHQMWFYWVEQGSDLWMKMSAMAIGDWVGTILMLYFTKVLILTVKKANKGTKYPIA